MVRWLRWHCPPDTGFEIRALAVWGQARYLSVTEAPHNTNFHTWMGEKQFCFCQTAETGNRTPDSDVKGSGANHYPRAPAPPPRPSTTLYKSLNHLMYLCNWSQLINEPTRVTPVTESALDLVIVSDKERITQLSDHFLTYCTRKASKNKLNAHNTVQIKSLKNYSPEN